MRVLIVGAGATGGYFGALLAQAGRDVTFLVRPDRAERLRVSGLQVVRPADILDIQPKTVTAMHLTEPYDIVILAVKAYALEEAIADMSAAVGPNTVILPLLNGMKHMDLLADRFGQHRLLGCLCKVATSLDSEGRIVQQGTFADMAYGELDGVLSSRLQRVHRVMSDAGFETKASTTINREMWEKWALLAAMGGINSLMRGSIGEVVAAHGGRDFANRFIDEILAVIGAVGEQPSVSFVENARQLLTLKDSAQTSSMYRDLISGRPIEADQIIGDLITRGKSAGMETPYLFLVYTNLLVFQNRRA